MYFADGIMDKNNPSKKPSSILYGMSVINLLIDLQIDKVHKNKSTRFISFVNLSVNLTYY
jgi:hypothetical protein